MPDTNPTRLESPPTDLMHDGSASAPSHQPDEYATIRVHGTAPPLAPPPDTILSPELEPVTVLPTPTTPDGRYQFIKELARGGMGIVFRGFDRELRRDLAVKILHNRHLDQPDHVRRFHDEAWIVGQLQHPGIVPIYDLGRLESGQPYFIMKLVDGRTLAHHLGRRSEPAQDRTHFLKIFEQICQTLAYAHSRGVIHRDLKPSNIMVGPFGEVQVMDWGLAKVMCEHAEHVAPPPALAVPRLTAEPDVTGSFSGEIFGTPAYMAPEQAKGDRLDERCDVFGLGAILCEILTGRPPYDAPKVSGTFELARHGNQTDARKRLDSCGADPELTALACACLAPERESRPANAGQVAQRMTAYLSGVEARMRQAELAGVAAQARAVEERKRRRLTHALAITLFTLVVVAGTSGILAARQRAHQADERAASLQEKQRRDSAARQTVHEALEEALALRDQARISDEPVLHWTRALAAARRASEVLPANLDDPDLRRQVVTLELELATLTQVALHADRDKKMLARLEGIRLHQTEVKNGSFDVIRADPEYDAAFREYGLDVNTGEVRDLAEAVRSRRIVADLTAALVDWAVIRSMMKGAADSQSVRLFAIAQAADPDPQRAPVYEALARHDQSALRNLADHPEIGKLPPSLIYVLALRLSGTRDLPLTLKLLRIGVRQYPSDFWLNHQLGMTLAPMNNAPPPDEALRYVAAAVTIRPQSPGARVNLALVFFNRGAYADAAAEYRQAIRLKDDYAEAHANLGMTLHRLGQEDEALSEVKKAIELQPSLVYAHDDLADILDALKRYDEAIAAVQRSIKLDPNRATAHLRLGFYFTKKNDWKSAEAAYRRGVELDPEFGMAHYNLGNALSSQNRELEAVEEYHKAIKLNPNHAEAICNLAHSLGRLRRFAEAHETMKRGHELGSKQANWPYASAEWVKRAGELAELDARFEAVRKGDLQPADVNEILRLAEFGYRTKQMAVASLALFDKAFDQKAELATGVPNPHRSLATQAAVRALAGWGDDARSLDDAQKIRCCRSALAWLRTDLAHLEKSSADRAVPALRAIEFLFLDEIWVPVRDPAAIAKLPPAERDAWTKFWSDAKTLRKKLSAASRNIGS